MSHRGIYRIRFDLAQGAVTGRAESRTARGTPYSVQSVTVVCADTSKAALKIAVTKVLSELLPLVD
jgi:hypothetical protein